MNTPTNKGSAEEGAASRLSGSRGFSLTPDNCRARTCPHPLKGDCFLPAEQPSHFGGGHRKIGPFWLHRLHDLVKNEVKSGSSSFPPPRSFKTPF